MIQIYQNSVVALIDLLGFKEAVKKEENAAEILHILRQIKKGENYKCTAATHVTGTTTTIKINPTISACYMH